MLSMFNDDDGDVETVKLKHTGDAHRQLVAAGSLDAATNAAAVVALADGLMLEQPLVPKAHQQLLDNVDDSEGYYRMRPGELLDGRYAVLGARGRGVFSSVLFCRDVKAGHGSTDDAAANDADEEAVVAAAAAGTVSTAAAPVVLSAATGARVARHAALATGSSAFVAVKLIRSNDTMRRAGAKVSVTCRKGRGLQLTW